MFFLLRLTYKVLSSLHQLKQIDGRLVPRHYCIQSNFLCLETNKKKKKYQKLNPSFSILILKKMRKKNNDLTVLLFFLFLFLPFFFPYILFYFFLNFVSSAGYWRWVSREKDSLCNSPHESRKQAWGPTFLNTVWQMLNVLVLPSQEANSPHNTLFFVISSLSFRFFSSRLFIYLFFICLFRCVFLFISFQFLFLFFQEYSRHIIHRKLQKRKTIFWA